MDKDEVTLQKRYNRFIICGGGDSSTITTERMMTPDEVLKIFDLAVFAQGIE